VIDCRRRQGRSFAPERADETVNVFDAVVAHIRALQGRSGNVSWGAVDRRLARPLCGVLRDHGLRKHQRQPGTDVQALPRQRDAALACLGPGAGFETGELAVVSEQDILGDRLVRPRSARPQAAAGFISGGAGAPAGDLVVHVDHGIGRFVGLKTIHAAGAPHDCLELQLPAACCSCRSRTSSSCRATAPRIPRSSSTASAAAAGRPARPR
jgi:transcription-repair coupling factor (superfamily II helicase)